MASRFSCSNAPASVFATAELRFLSQSNFKLVHVFVSNCVNWRVVDTSSQFHPKSIADFANGSSLQLNRLDNIQTWKDDMKQSVRSGERNRKPTIIVCGSLHGSRTLVKRIKCVLKRGVQGIEFQADSLNQHQAWLGQIRARIMPWTCLMSDIKQIANSGQSTRAQLVEEKLAGMAIAHAAPSTSTNRRVDVVGALPELMHKLDTLDEVVVHGTASVETGATLVKLVTSVEAVADIAEKAGDFAKCVAGVSTAFQLVVLCARAISLCAEAQRGGKVLPVCLARCDYWLRYVLRSLVLILNSEINVKEIHMEYVFDVYRELEEMIGTIESQLVRRRLKKALKAKVVSQVEAAMKDLQHKVATATSIADTVTFIHNTALTEKKTNSRLEALENESNRPAIEQHHTRPSVSPVFVGRTKELGKLQNCMNNQGSAVITGYGGVGKTALMTAFAAHAEEENDTLRVFWVTVNGGVESVLDSLAVQCTPSA